MKTKEPLFISNAIGHFALKGTIVSIDLNPNGHINDTFIVETTENKYIVQRLNCSVFPQPRIVMSNIENVTDYLRKSIVKRGGDPKRETLEIVKTVDGKNFYQDNDGNFFRAFVYVASSYALMVTTDPALLYEAGRVLGLFEKDLAGFPISQVKETIPCFHNTGKRFFAFVDAVKKDPFGRAKTVQKEIDAYLDNKDLASPLLFQPLRVSHNDAKLTNVLFDKKTNKALCLIDLDTVMPGFAVNDFGDAVRYDCSSAFEDEPDTDKVHFVFESYKAFLQGYLLSARDILSKDEIASLASGAEQMTFECGLRFLTDYILGDRYFKVDRPLQNLDRARAQAKLLSEMREKEALMASLVE